jgi:hypothetical protein
MFRLATIAAVVAALTACQPDAAARQADPYPSAPPSSAPAPTPSPSDTYGDARTGDSPPPDAPTDIPAPTSTDTVPSACGLVKQSDLVTLVSGLVKLKFPSAPVEKNSVDQLTGAASNCYWRFESWWTETSGGIDDGGASLSLQIQSAGVEGFVPPQPGVGTLVDGIGDGAVLRNSKLYVRLGEGMLIIELGITTPDFNSPLHDIPWEEELAKIVIARVRR